MNNGSRTGDHLFGGKWTEDKLNRVKRYLTEYLKIMSKQDYKTCYLDAFAGTGYRTVETMKPLGDEIFTEPEELEVSKTLADGSAKIALSIKPHFSEYHFVESRKKHFLDLVKLKDEFPGLTDRIQFHHDDANDFVTRFCADEKAWRRRRAVIFLDPYGMQVKWSTLEAIAQTKATDLWLLFPLGMAVNRMLCGHGCIPENWTKTLDDFFGEMGWREKFYTPDDQLSLLDLDPQYESAHRMQKVANYDSIEEYFVGRLKSIFPGVASNPKRLSNNTGCPLFILFFACATENDAGKRIALKVASHILKK